MKLPPRAADAVRQCARALAGVLGAALVLTGCSIETPSSSTSTEFEISVPVANDSTRIDALVGDRDDFLEIDPASGSMALRVTVPLPDEQATEPEILGTAEVGENLKVTPTANSFSTAIGDLSIPGQAIPEIAVDFETITGQDVPAGTEFPLGLPAASFGASVPLPLANVTSLSILTGGLDVEIDNDLPIGLTDVLLRLTDEGAGATVDEIDLGTIPPGGSASGSFDLNDKTISGDLSVTVAGSTQEASSFTLGENAELVINAELQTLLVSQATALIPQQEFADQQTLAFPDDRIQVTEAVMSNGGLTLVVTNNIPIIMEVALTLPDLVDANGVPQTFIVDSLVAGQPREVSFDLTNNTFAPANPLEMRIGYEARTFASDTEVTIASDGEIDIQALTEELVFSRVQGRLNEVRLTIPDEQKDQAARSIEFPDGLDNVNIGAAGLSVFITSGVGFLADVDILFTGFDRETGATRTLVVTETFERGNPNAPTRSQLQVGGSELVDFLNFLPDSIAVDPVIVVGDGQEEEIIEQSHFVNLDSVVFRTEPRLSVLADTRIDPDVQDISFYDSELRGKINTNFRDAFVITELESSIPVGIGVRLMVARTREAVYDTSSPDFVRAIPRRDLARFDVPAAPVDASGLSNGTSTNTVNITLDKDDVLDFILEDRNPNDPDSLFSGVRVTLPATGGEVEVRSTDFVNIISGLRLRLELNKDLVE